MSDKITQDASQFISEFFAEMNSWEVEFFAARKKNIESGRDDPEVSAYYKVRLENILSRFAIKDKSNFGRLIDLGCTNPPTYDPKTDDIDIVSAGEDAIVVGVQQTVGAEVSSRITIVYTAKDWKIKKKESLGYDDKWKRSPL